MSEFKLSVGDVSSRSSEKRRQEARRGRQPAVAGAGAKTRDGVTCDCVIMWGNRHLDCREKCRERVKYLVLRYRAEILKEGIRKDCNSELKGMEISNYLK